MSDEKAKEAVDHPAHYGGADKACSACEQTKPLEEFPPDARRKDGRGSKCRACARAAAEEYYKRYPETEAKRRLANSEHSKAWHARNRDTQIDRMRWSRAAKLYGISREDYAQMLAAQGGCCAICGTDAPGRKDKFFAIDHDHSTGRVRSLLCQRCNSGLGYFQDSPDLMRKAAEYVEKHRA